jgi:ADP-heptose:LPS heptosyltransferase
MGLARFFGKRFSEDVPMILIAPYAQKLVNGKRNPKNYPWWEELIAMIDDRIVQVGVEGEKQLVPDFRKNLTIPELRHLIQKCRLWISCDSFLQHLGWDEGKQGIVLWSVSDPLIYGHPENINLLKSRQSLSENQFLWWDSVEYDATKFVDPTEVIKYVHGN